MQRKKVLIISLLSVTFVGCKFGEKSAGDTIELQRERVRSKLCDRYAEEPIHNGASALCSRRSSRVRIGSLSESITESSGLAFSQTYNNRLYHINDGSTARFFVSNGLGQGTLPVDVDVPGGLHDIEDISVGPCGTSEELLDNQGVPKSCLFIADSGDNYLTRDFKKIIVIEEQETYPVPPAMVTPRAVLTVHFGQNSTDDEYRRRDTEAMAVHPVTGDIFLINKMLPGSVKVLQTSSLWRLRRSVWDKGEETVLAKLENRGSINFNHIGLKTLCLDPSWDPLTFEKISLESIPSTLDPTHPAAKILVTSFDFITSTDPNENGKKFVLLTYGNAVEIDMDLGDQDFKFPPLDQWIPNRDFKLIDMPDPLAQQEALALIPNSEDIVFTSENLNGEDGIYTIPCAD